MRVIMVWDGSHVVVNTHLEVKEFFNHLLQFLGIPYSFPEDEA
jgi:hypothetical protein